jgi:uncharacterized protein (TIGR03067 family)
MLDGTWIAVHAELGGAPLPDDVTAGMTLTIRDGRYHVQNDRGHLTLDGGRQPAMMDIVGDEGPNQGRTIRAIYELANGRLRICYELGSADRPPSFTSEPGTLLLLATYHRK